MEDSTAVSKVVLQVSLAMEAWELKEELALEPKVKLASADNQVLAHNLDSVDNQVLEVNQDLEALVKAASEDNLGMEHNQVSADSQDSEVNKHLEDNQDSEANLVMVPKEDLVPREDSEHKVLDTGTGTGKGTTSSNSTRFQKCGSDKTGKGSLTRMTEMDLAPSRCTRSPESSTRCSCNLGSVLQIMMIWNSACTSSTRLEMED